MNISNSVRDLLYLDRKVKTTVQREKRETCNVQLIDVRISTGIIEHIAIVEPWHRESWNRLGRRPKQPNGTDVWMIQQGPLVVSKRQHL